jgi:hypothetical protein
VFTAHTLTTTGCYTRHMRPVEALAAAFLLTRIHFFYSKITAPLLQGDQSALPPAFTAHIPRCQCCCCCYLALSHLITVRQCRAYIIAKLIIVGVLHAALLPQSGPTSPHYRRERCCSAWPAATGPDERRTEVFYQKYVICIHR